MNSRGAYQKKQRNLENLQERKELLEEGNKDPACINAEVGASLVGQRAFAALTVKGTRIRAMSLNTLKSLANELFNEKSMEYGSGFKFLEAQRIKLLAALSDRSPPAPTVGDGTGSENVQKLEERVHGLESQHILRLKAYFDLYGKIRALVGAYPGDLVIGVKLKNILDDHDAMFSGLLCPLPDGAKPQTSPIILPRINPESKVAK